MKRRTLTIGLYVFFAALIAIPVVLKQVSERHVSSSAGTRHDAGMAGHGFQLQEVAKAAGIDFTAPFTRPQK